MGANHRTKLNSIIIFAVNGEDLANYLIRNIKLYFQLSVFFFVLVNITIVIHTHILPQISVFVSLKIQHPNILFIFIYTG